MTSWMVSMGSSTGDVPEGEIMMTLGVLIFLLLFLGGFLLCKIDFRDKPRWRSRARILQLRRDRWRSFRRPRLHAHLRAGRRCRDQAATGVEATQCRLEPEGLGFRV